MAWKPNTIYNPNLDFFFLTLPAFDLLHEEWQSEDERA